MRNKNNHHLLEIHIYLALLLITENIGHSLFTHSNGQSSNTYFEENFEPEWDLTPEIPENV